MPPARLCRLSVRSVMRACGGAAPRQPRLPVPRHAPAARASASAGAGASKLVLGPRAALAGGGGRGGCAPPRSTGGNGGGGEDASSSGNGGLFGAARGVWLAYMAALERRGCARRHAQLLLLTRRPRCPHSRPLVTKSLTAGFLNGLGDVLCQALFPVEGQARLPPSHTSPRRHATHHLASCTSSSPPPLPSRSPTAASSCSPAWAWWWAPCCTAGTRC